MFNQRDEDEYYEEERFFSWYRIKTVMIGSVAVIIIGSLLVSLYTQSQYGGTPFDSLFGKTDKSKKDEGKLAYDKQTKIFIGIIRGEGHSRTYRKQVYYIERNAGQLYEYPKDMIEVREPGQK
ncbi:MAG: hypothetical protein L0229_06445 [Blastocatellia bacterium]|nr:hypothetical protein [Blastocatellia bacterium]